VQKFFARKRVGFRRALPAAILTVALAVAGAPVVGLLTAEPASAAPVGQSDSTSGQRVYANGTGTNASPNLDKVGWLSWGAPGTVISTDPNVVRTVTNRHQISATERVEVTCSLTPKRDVSVLSSTFDTGSYAPWTKANATSAVGLGLVTDPDTSRTGQSLRMTSIPAGYDTVALDLLPLLSKGSTYTISFKARLASSASTASAHFTVFGGGTSYTWVGNETPLSASAWTTITGTYTLPTGATEAKMYVDLTKVGAFPLDLLIDDVAILGTSTTSVQAYQPGGWAGDGLPQLYPGIGPVGIKQVGPEPASVSYSVACDSKLVEYDAAGTVVLGSRPVGLGGLVFADAESTRTNEYVAATPQGAFASSPWRQIDRFHGGCSAQHGFAQATVTGATWQLRLDNPGRECSTGGTPNAVMLASGANALDIVIHGEGFSAAAVGYVLAADYGDAPSTFGAAGALLQPTWSGTMVGAGTTKLAGYEGTGGNCVITNAQMNCAAPYVVQNGQLSTIAAPTLSLGATAAGNGSVPFSADATGDTADENAFGVGVQPSAVDARPGVAPSVVTAATCRGGSASVAGWLDWNGNGTFDTGERSNVVSCPAGSTPAPVTLTWPSVASVNPPAGGSTFLRLRVSTDQSDLTSATRASINGEVEDWRVTVRAPQVSVTKQADVATVPGPGQPVRYTVTLRNIGTLDFTSTYPAYLADDVTAAADDAALGAVTVAPVGAPAATVAGNRVAWSGALAAGQAVTFTYDMVVRAAPADRIMTNLVQASPTTLGPSITCTPSEAAAGRCARVDLWAVGMTVTKRAYDAGGAQLSNGAALRPATVVRWNYVVTNTGSAPLRNITVKDDWSETRTSAGSTVPTSGLAVITCPGLTPGTSVVIPTLAVGGSVTCTATRTVVPDP
jgi:hypothetical protein